MQKSQKAIADAAYDDYRRNPSRLEMKTIRQLQTIRAVWDMLLLFSKTE